MNKIKVIALVGDGDPRLTAERLKYKNRNQCYHWPKEFTDRQKEVILRRLKAEGYKSKIPADWK